MVFCTLETGIFGLISEGQLMVRVRQIRSHFFQEILGSKSKIYSKYFKREKSALFLQM
jgi:hypothetical protein